MTPLHHAGHSQRLGHHITCFVCIVILSLIHNTECLPKAHSNSNEPLSSHFADYLLLSYAYTITKPKTKPKSYITIGSQAFVNIITHWWVTDCLRWCLGCGRSERMRVVRRRRLLVRMGQRVRRVRGVLAALQIHVIIVGLVQLPAPLRGHAVYGRHGVQRTGAQLVAQNAADAGHRGHVVLVTHAVGQQPVPDLPREYPRVFRF